MPKENLLIFDFDGTIVDSKFVYYQAMNRHLSSFFSKKEVDKAIDMGMTHKTEVL
ncbi:MAG: HAD hydrolase-like protein [Ignavibacteriales bacterium]|nr:HAD hydrolase-like protein [Ignavibacteriales bacterium]